MGSQPARPMNTINTTSAVKLITPRFIRFMDGLLNRYLQVPRLICGTLKLDEKGSRPVARVSRCAG
jgi:hypothetical protein